MSRPQIVIVNDFAHVNGGTAKVALLSAMHLAQNGYRVTLVAAVPPIMPELAASGVEVYCLDRKEIATDPRRFRAMGQGIWNWEAGRLISRVLANRDTAQTVVHIHGWTKSLSPSVVAVATRSNCPVVLTMHDYFLACPNGGFYDYGKGEICRRTPLTRSCVLTNCDKRGYAQKLWRVGRQVIQREFAGLPSGVRHFIAISNVSRDVLAPFLPGDAQVHFVDNPIEGVQVSRVDVAANDRFVWVGRLAPEKGPTLFARATTDLGLRAFLVGDGECRAEVIRKAPSAEITGWCDSVEVRSHLRSARCLVLSSLWYETQGMVVLEAASQGIPAIVPDTCAARDLIVDGVTGLWFKGGDINDLKAKMMKMMDPALSSSMGRAAYERYWSQPKTIDNHVRQLADVYERILGRTFAGECLIGSPVAQAVML